MYQWKAIESPIRYVTLNPLNLHLAPQSFVEHDSKRATTAYLREYLYGMLSAVRNFDGELL